MGSSWAPPGLLLASPGSSWLLLALVLAPPGLLLPAPSLLFWSNYANSLPLEGKLQVLVLIACATLDKWQRTDIPGLKQARGGHQKLY